MKCQPLVLTQHFKCLTSCYVQISCAGILFFKRLKQNIVFLQKRSITYFISMQDITCMVWTWIFVYNICTGDYRFLNEHNWLIILEKICQLDIRLIFDCICSYWTRTSVYLFCLPFSINYLYSLEYCYQYLKYLRMY